jgi:hypothetical protein
VSFGPSEVHRLARELKVPFVSTNVLDADGRPLAEPLRLVNIAGRRIAVLGVLSSQYATDAVKIVDPADAAAAALAEHTPRYDALLVLAYLPADELAALAARLPEKAVVVGPSLVAQTVREARKPLAGAVGQAGRSLVRIDFAKGDRDRWTSRELPVTPDLSEDSAQIAIREAYHRDLAGRDFSADETSFSMPLPPEVASAHRVAGTNTCRVCHAEDCAAWDISRHARAWQSLVDRGVQYDASCQRCHTTGFGWEGGFASVEQSAGILAGIINVGCESCHGPSNAHANDPAIRTPLVASQQCVHCHDAQNSPGFDYTAAWARIGHGRARAAVAPQLPAGKAVEAARAVN